MKGRRFLMLAVAGIITLGMVMAPPKAEAQNIGVDKNYTVYAKVLNRGTWQWEEHFESHLTWAQAQTRYNYWTGNRDSVNVHLGRTTLEWVSPE